jgi:2-dehydro-3-deoxyphosphogluconate aldolase / (4S)-4-hydroxy-2-oxoglutarate aldolase
MTREDVRWRIASLGIVPVIRASTAKKAFMAIDALRDGGIPVVEVTLTVPGAEDVIESLRKDSSDDLLVGAGTVTDVAGARRCLEAGAQFIVSPGLDIETLAFVTSQKVLMIAGALTPSEVLAARKAGADEVKIFPCSAVGGPSYIKFLRGPFPNVPFIPTGGVNLKTAADFIRAGSEALGIGGELVSQSALEAGRPQEITALARQFMEIVSEARAVTMTANIPK